MSINNSPTTNPSQEAADRASPTAMGTEGPLVIDGISYIPSSVLLTGIPKFSIKDDRAFGVVDSRGDCPRLYSSASELGFYFNDTRYLSTWEFNINGSAPVALSNELRYGGNTLVLSMTNRDLESLDTGVRIPRDMLLIRRILTFMDDTLYEVLAIRNFDNKPHDLRVEQWAGSRFDDIFEVRGYARKSRGKIQLPSEEHAENSSSVTLKYSGLDLKQRSTHIQRMYACEKIRLTSTLSGTSTRVTVPSKGDVFLRTIVSFDKTLSDPNFLGQNFESLSIQHMMKSASEAEDSSHISGLTIETDNAIVNRAIQQAKTDIRMLLTRESMGDGKSVLYPYAGVPWYSAPFGRDGIITAYQLLPWYPKVAHGVLDYCFKTIGTRIDDFTDEQPGKVFHELRRGEMSNTREVPFIPYFGSVDSTPLSLILLHEYISWTMDLEKLREWWPHALRALAWIEKWGDPNQDGFLEYAKQSPTGLVNQGWKDSHDSIMHADGTLAQAPISLCEVQGYAFRARKGMADMARLLGHHDLASRLRIEALQLRARFMEKFWDTERKFIYLALDGSLKPCQVVSSNMGHCLWSNILLPEFASQVTEHLMSKAMFNGYGIRTLSDDETAYNPMSYHNGSIWPHDNSLIMEGLRNYGQKNALSELSLAMINVLEASHDFRLPELFCGFRRRGNEPPVPYEVACKPQAWAAGSVFLMLKSMMGISMDIDQNYVVFNSPLLTSKIGEMHIKGLRGRDWEMDVLLKNGRTGTSVEVTRKVGHVRVLTVK